MKSVIYIITVVIISLIISFIVAGCSGCNYSSGIRVGILTKFSEKGVFWKTWEGELTLGGLIREAKGYVANTWGFSIRRDDPKTEIFVKVLQYALEEGKEVKIVYEDRGFFVGPWHSSTVYWITDVIIKE